MRPQGWVVDLNHYLDEETGDLPADAPSRIVNLVVFFGSIVAWVTDHLPEGDWHTNVPCWRSPGRKRCLGEIMSRSMDFKSPADESGAGLETCWLEPGAPVSPVINRVRNFTSAPCEKGARVQPRQPNTNCRR
jgi:hypothetical protein